MRAKVTFLGTSSVMPTKTRNVSATHMQFGKYNFLFDCGEGTQRQMTFAKISAVKVGHVFISHLHGDHLYGLPGFIETCAMRNREDPLYLHGPKGLKKYVCSLLSDGLRDLSYDVKIETGVGKIVDEKTFEINAFKVKHDIESYGYCFKEKDSVNVDEPALVKMGVKPGRMYKQIKEGKDFEWEGKKLKAKKFLIERPGLRVVYSGDTMPCDNTLKWSDHADLLIHEAMFASDASDLAKKRKHSTAKDVAELATQANVKCLALTHFSTRYKSVTKLRDEAMKKHDNVVMAEDLSEIEL